MLVCVGHVTWDQTPAGPVLGGSVAYAAATARKLGWQAAVITAAGPDFEAARDLPGVEVVCRPSAATTRFRNSYERDGTRSQAVTARAEDVDLSLLPEPLRSPAALFLGPVIGELPVPPAQGFTAGVVGAGAQGWLRETDAEGRVRAREWPAPERDLAGVHALFLSQHDLPPGGRTARDFLAMVPMVVLTRGWEGLTLLTPDASYPVPSLPRREVDPTGAGDVFAAAFLLRYHEVEDPLEACAFAACAASCAVEGVGTLTLGDREEIRRRLVLRQRLIEEGDWEE